MILEKTMVQVKKQVRYDPESFSSRFHCMETGRDVVCGIRNEVLYIPGYDYSKGNADLIPWAEIPTVISSGFNEYVKTIHEYPRNVVVLDFD